MRCENSRINTIKGTIIYILGAKKSKEQEFLLLNSNDLFIDQRIVQIACYAKDVGERKKAKKELADSIQAELADRTLSASRRVKNAAPYCGYISFAPKDRAKLDTMAAERWPEENKAEGKRLLLCEIMEEYMRLMKWQDTQHIFVQHLDKNNDHVHFAISSINPDGTAIDNHNSEKRSDTALAILEKKYGLELVHKRAALKEERKAGRMSEEEFRAEMKKVRPYVDHDYCPDETQQDEHAKALTDAKKTIRQALLLCPTFEYLQLKLKKKNIDVCTSNKHKRPGYVFIIDGEPISGFDLNPLFTYGNINKRFQHNSGFCRIVKIKENEYMQIRVDGKVYTSLNKLDGTEQRLFLSPADRQKYTVKFKKYGIPVMKPTGEYIQAEIAPSQTPSQNFDSISIPVAGHTQRSNADASKNKGDIDYGEAKYKGVKI